MIDPKVLQAADELEDIAVLAKQMVIDLREGKDNAYGRLYWLRRRLTRALIPLGADVPKGLEDIRDYYENDVLGKQ